MSKFLKYTMATVLGVFIYVVLSSIILFGVIEAISSASQNKEVEIEENSFLYLKLNKEIVDRAVDNPFENFNFSTMESDNPIGLNNLLEQIEKAKGDDDIKGIYMNLSYIPAGIATVEEVRDALLDFKESGKFIYTYAETLSQGAYYVASVSDKIYMNPVGSIALKGLSAQVTFFKHALEKLGVEPMIFRHGKFKSAIEPFMLDKMSEASKEQTSTFVQSIWDHIVVNIEATRGLNPGTLNKFANELAIRDPQSALDNGMIDGLKYRDEVIAELVELTGVENEKELKAIKLGKYSNVVVEKEKKRKGSKFKKDKVAVVYASGEIVSGKGNNSIIGSETISKAIRKARKDSTVKAIVFRINSGGGSALASDVIWREAVLAKEVKPFIVSMGDVAASGGYYIACPADKILASEVSITGSIGVFGLMFNTQELMNEKLGVTFDGIKTNQYADMPNTNRKMRAAERDIIQQSVEQVYKTFITHVAEGRDMTTKDVDAIGQGRVWSGVNAMEIGLIDEYGGLNRAIELASEAAGISDFKVVDYPKQADPMQEFLKQLTGDVKVKWLKRELGEQYMVYKKMQMLQKQQGIQARMPFDVDIY